MRILSVNPTDPDEAGGAAGATIRLNEHLRLAGHTVDELFYSDLLRIRDKRWGLDLLPAAAARRLRRVARTYDVIDAVGHTGALLFRLLGKGRPLLVARTVGLEHTDFAEAQRNATLEGRSIKLTTRAHHGFLRLRSVEAAIRAADAFVSPLATDADFVVSRGWKARTEVASIGHGVTPEALAARRQPRAWAGRLVWCGTLIERKGWPTFAAAFEQVADELDLSLDIVGSRLPANEVLGATGTALRSRTRIHPLLERREQFELMASGDMFVSTSNSEGWHLALQEAMAIGLPSAATRTGLLLDIEDWESVVLPLPKRSADGVADKLREAAANPDGLLSRASRALELQQSMSWPRVADRTAAWLAGRLEATHAARSLH
jgi:glycosyltransferase involved in cell wall biosynthesis